MGVPQETKTLRTGKDLQEPKDPRTQQNLHNREVPQETGDPQETETTTPHLEEQTQPPETNRRTEETPKTETAHHKTEADNLREDPHHQLHLRGDHPTEMAEVPDHPQDNHREEEDPQEGEDPEEEEDPQEGEDPEDHRTTHLHPRDHLRGQHKMEFTRSYQWTHTTLSSRNSRYFVRGNGAHGDQHRTTRTTCHRQPSKTSTRGTPTSYRGCA
jgi:hypothetical protein